MAIGSIVKKLFDIGVVHVVSETVGTVVSETNSANEVGREIKNFGIEILFGHKIA